MKTRPEIAKAAAEARIGMGLGNGTRGQFVADRLGRGKALRAAAVWPGGSLPILIQVLTAAEREESRGAASQVLKERGIDLSLAGDRKADAVTVGLVTVEIIHQVLARAVLDAATGDPLFADAAELTSVATEDEVESLFHLYVDHRRSVDPDFRSISDEEFAEIEEAVKKKDASRLSAIASSMPRRSLLTLVDQLASSLTGKSTSISESPQQSPEMERDVGESGDPAAV